MKNKSFRHKDTNTFKFQTFSERISGIDVDVFHRVAHEYETEIEEDACLFYQAIQKWNVLNLTESYNSFRKEIHANNNITLAQLIHNKDHIIEVLIKHLKYKNVLCLQPLLELVVALAQDLRKDFYDYYPQFLEILIDLLNTKDTEQLEWTFTCLAYLFKFLWRTLIKDISTVFTTLLPLLSDNRPEYINNFAAESFAFVARKVKDRRSFLQLIIKAVRNNQDGISGCGKLLFEVINGVNGQFHSCADTILPFYFESLQDERLPQAVLFDILEQVIGHVLTEIRPEKGELLWKVCVNQLDKLSESWRSTASDKTENTIDLILKCVGQAVEYRGGRFLRDPATLIQHVLKLLSLSDLSGAVLLTVTKIVILLLLSKHVRLQQEQAWSLTKKVLDLPDKSNLLYFVEHTSTSPSFEAQILPSFLKYCIKHSLDDQTLQVLTQLVLKKSPLSRNGIKLEEWKKYAIDFNSKDANLKVETILHGFVKVKNYSQLFDCFDNYLSALTCLPHLSLQNTSAVEASLRRNIQALCDSIKTAVAGQDDVQLRKLLFILHSTVECSVHVMDCTTLGNLRNVLVDCVLPLSDDYMNVCALQILDLYMTAIKDSAEVVTREMLLEIHAVLENNFSSPYHEVRLLTAHIYSLFDSVMDLKSVDALEEWNVFNLCFKVESIKPDVHTYREQLLYLEKFNFDKPQMSMCKETQFCTVPLRYLCGVLYMNFKLLWEPVINIISSHAVGLDINVFWNVYRDELNGVIEHIRDTPDVNRDFVPFKFTFLGDLYQDTYRIEVMPDFVNYRLLLWQAMSEFPEVAEARTKDVSEKLLNFIEEEYMKSNTDIALTWNIKQNVTVITEQETEIDDDEEGDGVNEADKNLPTKPVVKIGAKNKIKSLINHLAVFAKVRSPKSMYREPELYKLYFDLLSHKSHEVQKVALDCIMTYKFKHLVPYREHLYRLIDDKNFKNELTAFRIDKETSIIQEEHRENLIPIVMKIVFSKMFAKTGLRTGGKSSGQFRRNLILRFLAGCHENELLGFIQMVFRYYEAYFQDDPQAMVDDVCARVNLEKFISPKKLQSTVNLLNVILEQFGGLMGEDLLRFLLKLLLVIGAFLKGAFNQNADVHAGYLSALRNLRTTSIKIAERFFSQFQQYAWSLQEVNAVFDVFVWPYLDKLNVEGIHSPTALLKLLVLWGTTPCYFPLLVKHEAKNNSQYALPHIMKLLLNERTHITVSNLIMEMIEKLLTLQLDEDETKIVIDNELPIEQKILDRLKLNENLNYGSCILLPHVSSVLEKIKRKLESKSKNVNQRELLVLSRISELVWESDISDKLLQLLLPVVLKRCVSNASEEVVLQLLTTVNNLMQNVLEPHKHLKLVSPLFGEVTYPSSRKLLCQILTTAGTKCDTNQSEQLKSAAELIVELNAWDAKWVDQPDFQRRSDAFRRIKTIVDENSLSLDLGVLIIYNCYYLIRSEKDLSLRESASDSWRSVAPALIKQFTKMTERTYIIDSTLLNLVRNGLKARSDEIRNECILLLGCMSRECPDAHVVLRDLNKVTNENDLEVDFFENLTHLQVHRHARALLKFSTVFKQESTSPSTRTLTQFILPLTSHYLCNEKFMNKNNIIDGAIETIGTVCRLLPWHQYEGLLKYYLGKLRYKIEYQKQLVRLTVVILDAFHFDLSKGQDVIVEQRINLTKEGLNELKDEDEKQNSVQEVGDVVVGDGKGKTEKGAEIKREENEVDIDEILDEIRDDEDNEEVKEEMITVKPYEKITVLCKSAATRITRTIQTILLPQLHRALAEMTHYEAAHKVNRKRKSIEKEEQDLLRVPISLAVVKLLQRLPTAILEANLPGVFMKLCTFLKSQLESVRRVARETLQKIMLGLGPQYLTVLLAAIEPLLSRGFQIHVLVYTLHGVISCLKEMYRPNDIDKVLLTVIKICKADLFGVLAEEKEVSKIVSKVSEAKSSKSIDTFQVLAQYITDRCLMDLIMPIKDILFTSHSYKIVNKAQECLRHIALGLVDNKFISTESLLKFSFGMASESIPQLLAEKDKPALSEKEREKLERQKPDCYIIAKEPVYRSGRRVSNVKSSAKTNAHVLVEFGLRLCHFLLKRDKLRDGDYKPFVDPFVGVFKNCLKAKHVKLSTVTLQCLQWVLKYDLPSMKENIKEITESLFDVLHKYASAGLSKGDNFDLVVAAFKTMSVLVRDVKYHTIETEQLKILLLYVEQDLLDYDRQATAFGLLKSIITRKLIVPEIHVIMSKVAELSITSELTHIRVQSRLVFHQFILDYPLGNKLDKNVSFFISQLSYEMQTGRESALEMIQSFILSFPMKVLREYSGTFLITLGARLVNDEVPECRKMAASCISSMLTRLTRPNRDPLFDVIALWLKDRKINHQRLAAQLCGILVEVEKSAFESRIPTLMPLILLQFGLDDNDNQPGRFVRLKCSDETESEEKDRVKDHHLFQVLQLLLKICGQCPKFLKRRAEVEGIAKHAQALLAYPHEWVRLAAAQFLGFVLSSLDIEHLAELLITDGRDDTGYLCSDPESGLKSLALDLCAQLQPNAIKSELAEQVVKNLVFVARVLQRVPKSEGTANSKINLTWLTKRMRKIVNTEVVEAPLSGVLRTEVFKWIAGVGTALELDSVLSVLHHLLAPLVREMITTEESNAPLRQLSKEVGMLLKKRVGVETYTSTLSKLQQHLSVKRAERKRSRTQLAVTDPEIYAKRKIKHHERKKEAKKRKISERKGTGRKFKRRKVVDLEDNSEIM